MQKRTYQKGLLMTATLIATGVILTAWTVLLIVMQTMMWFPL